MNDPSCNAHVRAVRVRTLWRTRAAARAQRPMHDILPSLLSSPFIPCHPHCLFTPPVIGPLGLTRRRSVNCCSWNWGGGLQNTCFRTSASSVPVLSHCTCPGLRCLTSPLHSYTPTRMLLRATHPVPHRLPRLGNDFFRS